MDTLQSVTFQSHSSLTPSQIADLRLAASKLTGPARRSFEAEMTWKYCEGNSLKAEAVFGWGRHTVALGLAGMMAAPSAAAPLGPLDLPVKAATSTSVVSTPAASARSTSSISASEGTSSITP